MKEKIVLKPPAIGLCSVQEFKDDYDIRKFDFDREPDTAGAGRVRRMCRDCPKIAACYDDAIDFIEKDLEISGVYGGFSTDRIYEHARGQRIGHGVVETVRHKLLERQVKNIITWGLLRQLKSEQ